MKVTELSLEERTELKRSYYCNVIYAGERVSYLELAHIDDLVTDDEINEVYAQIVFSEEDYLCNQ